jgi:hypothetical protein
MRAPWPLVFAMFGILAFPPSLGAQPRRSVGGTGRPVTSGPGLRSPATSIHGRLPAPTIGIVAPFRGTDVHRPTYYRSSVLGLVGFDWYWWLYPDGGDATMARPLAMPPSGTSLAGGLQLDVEPRRAFVYVDRVLAGTVDQFKGYYQHLEISAGFHVIDFLAHDYEPLTVGVTVVPNQTTTFRAFLNRAAGR